MTPPRPTRAVCYATVLFVDPENKTVMVKVTDNETGMPAGVITIGNQFCFNWRTTPRGSVNERQGVIRFTSGPTSVHPLSKDDNIIIQIEITGATWAPISWYPQKNTSSNPGKASGDIQQHYIFSVANPKEDFFGSPDSISRQLFKRGHKQQTGEWPEGMWYVHNPKSLKTEPCVPPQHPGTKYLEGDEAEAA